MLSECKRETPVPDHSLRRGGPKRPSGKLPRSRLIGDSHVGSKGRPLAKPPA